MSSAVVRADPAKISTTLKEATVDSLLNLTFSRISGHGPEGQVLFGSRPRSILAAAFLLPPLRAEGTGDEVTQPIRITAHGLDCQVHRGIPGIITVEPRLQVYVRVLPTPEDMKRPDCAPRFRLSDEVRKLLQTQTKEALSERWKIESAGKSYKRRIDHPQWREIEQAVRREVLERLKLPVNITTLFSVEGDGTAEPGEGSGEGVVATGGVLPEIRDEVFKPMDLPHKWLRVPIDQAHLPALVIDPAMSTAEIAAKVKQASGDLTAAVQLAVRQWADSDEGKLWCMRKGVVVRPSQYRDWPKFLEELRADPTRELALPEIVLSWEVKLSADWTHPTRTNLHISLENVSEEPRRSADLTDQSIFQVHLEVSMPRVLHAPLRLGRVEASYRYNSFLDYPAMGFNGGVQLQHSPDPNSLRLRTTWAPRYTQPRITPKSYAGINPTMRFLATPEGLDAVLPLGDALDDWFAKLDETVDLAAGLEPGDKTGLEREQGGFAKDKQGWEKEIAAVKAGLEILQESKAAWDKTAKRGPQADDKAVVYEAWLCMNQAMADLMRDKLKSDYGAWRLFQIAFVIAHVPAMASRMKCFRDKYDRERDDTVSLLYFATGGGKSEAFFGLLVFSLFLDRLRGKHVGVTAMIRYPLRLLTIQQAQRCALALARAEQVRKHLAIGGDPFAIGFWVGSGGSPNNHYAPGVADIPDIQEVPADLKSERDHEAAEVNYELQKAAWNKIPSCPFCRSETVLRRFADKGGTLAHVCSNARCESNTGGYQPLPFYICDVDIYDLAPSVLLGTVDKLALIGQSSGTLRRIYAMLGAAPLRDRGTKRLVMPSRTSEFEGDVESKGYEKLYPAYPDGTHLFHDPFPSLLIQDEAHLLDESLGTFAGLFESALDAVLTSIAKPLYALVAYEPDGSTRRRAKVVAASATVSDPDRQLEHLYQRPVPAMQFPYPGQSLYESFYAGPTAPPEDESQRATLKNVEEWSRWSRVYVGFMTNGRAHTATTVAVLSNFHTIITEVLLALTSGDEAQVAAARAKLVESVSPGTLEQLYRDKLLEVSPSELATVVDLHRIALTYVTNKKGGDQIMAAEFEETRKRHAERKLPISDLRTNLITGSVSQGEIQATVQEAQTRPKPGEPLPELTDALRSVIATSAVSHGVDVEEFNSMFFAGMPSDVAEYIQASSRVGRTHVGFVVLIPTPQRRRDRYIVEVFDSYHRFLERMVSPAAIDRWAGRAIERVLPSFIQAYLSGVRYVSELYKLDPDKKHTLRDLSWIPFIVDIYKNAATKGPLIKGICEFIEKAIGLEGDFAPGGKQHYQELIRERVETLLTNWARDALGEQRSLMDYFKAQPSVMNRPMTSLRDVDEAGVIYFGHRDLDGRHGVSDGVARKVMRFIRCGVAEGSDLGE
ncbi:helicase-related protein [Roseateles cellulosilyticus]|uniref:Helicase n=1 Tax=Pelomonas cellulosilytica TaxID=2906762 RepID=A0ABS8XYE3_9BURK|nr:helicase-related protein [Pelomonas sp. P8]MCE4556285.1 helicase [Pelomonas sp. P8]